MDRLLSKAIVKETFKVYKFSKEQTTLIEGYYSKENIIGKYLFYLPTYQSAVLSPRPERSRGASKEGLGGY